MIEILATGSLTSVQDLGRAGYASWGIAAGGAADRASVRLANRLVGNSEGSAAFEVLLGGAAFLFRQPALIAVTGAPTPLLIGGAQGSCDGPQRVAAGAVVELLPPSQQLRSYLAVRGGLATQPMLGSRSVDEGSGLGRPLRAGDVVPVGSAAVAAPQVDVAPRRAWPRGPLTLQAVRGPRDDWFTAASLTRFQSVPYTVDAASDRVGVRLSGPPLDRRFQRELLSEPTIRGAVEVPPDGMPIIFAADHPTTCGYPVIAVLEPDSADLAAQCRPGQSVTFTLSRPRMCVIPHRHGTHE